jgi:ribose-phosphate pyrophosphokinase
MIKITSNITGKEILYKHFFFGGGEQHLQILDDLGIESVEIFLRYFGDSDIIKLSLLVDALRNTGCKSISLKIPYFPAARQDRICNSGEPFSVKVYSNLINNMNFDKVTVFDPHSDVTPALINNVRVVDNTKFVYDVISSMDYLDSMKRSVLVSPDAGSNKKVANVAKYLFKKLYNLPVIRADKLRDVRTGEIIETTVYADDLSGKECYIIDDICSKGGTFCALAKVLKEKGASKVYLLVSHYEGTANLQNLKSSGIDYVFTTDSKPFVDRDASFLSISNIEKYI